MKVDDGIHIAAIRCLGQALLCTVMCTLVCHVRPHKEKRLTITTQEFATSDSAAYSKAQVHSSRMLTRVTLWTQSSRASYHALGASQRASMERTPTWRTRYIVALMSVTLNGMLYCAVRFQTRSSGGAEPDQTVCASKPFGGSSVVQTSRAMVCVPQASVLRAAAAALRQLLEVVSTGLCFGLYSQAVLPSQWKQALQARSCRI